MKKLALAAAVIGGLVVAGSGDGGEKKGKDHERDGTWVVVGMEQDGKQLAAQSIKKLIIKLSNQGDKYTVTMADKVIDKGTSTVDAQKKPYSVDIKGEEGPYQGKTVLAIYEINGDAMKVCYDLEGNGRPTEFSTKPGSGQLLIQYQRETKKKSE
jgi:uncharacterized protein (TIGR03067 family)